MNIQRFQAATLREALAKARRTFGESTLILSSRDNGRGFEVLATDEQSLAAQASPPAAAPAPARAAPAGNVVEEDTERLAMSTLSFQDYVRERMLSKRHERAAPQPAAAPARQASRPPAPRPAPQDGYGLSNPISDQLNAMQTMLEERLGAMAWLGQTRQDPLQANLLLKLVRAGYSPELSRKLLEKLPRQLPAAEAFRRMMETLAHNVRTDEGGPSLVEEGGTFAVVGPTGVGKTAAVTKLVARCIATHGVGSVGLISMDAHRAGAHEQLRASVRPLGVVAHMAHDQAALRELLSLLDGKKMVVIDTAGMAPRDARVRDVTALSGIPGLKHLLALSAVTHGEAVSDAVKAYRTPQLAGALICKADEAVKLGPVLDAVIRHKLVLRGVCTGQRVGEDLVAARAGELVRLSMRSEGRSAFDPAPDDLGLFFSAPARPAAPIWAAA